MDKKLLNLPSGLKDMNAAQRRLCYVRIKVFYKTNCIFTFLKQAHIHSYLESLTGTSRHEYQNRYLRFYYLFI